MTEVTERDKFTDGRDRAVSRDHRDRLIARNYELWNQSTGGVTGLTGSGAVLRYPARDEMRARCLAEELPANGQAGTLHDAAPASWVPGPGETLSNGAAAETCRGGLPRPSQSRRAAPPSPVIPDVAAEA